MRFYCEAKPKSTSKRSQELTDVQAKNYHTDSLNSSVLQSIGIYKTYKNIIWDMGFKFVSHALHGKFKAMTKYVPISISICFNLLITIVTHFEKMSNLKKN